jgi:hypothetical protein
LRDAAGGRGATGDRSMIHYHGTPITPKTALDSMVGQHFCVSYFRPDSLKTCLRIGQSLMLDNGAFSCFTRQIPFDLHGFYEWIEPILAHPHWAVVPDVIGGSVETQRQMTKTWPFGKEFGIPVWHLGIPLDYLFELSDTWGRVCFGSSGEFWKVGSPKWSAKMDEAFNALNSRYVRLPWVHGLRMLGQGLSDWPLASADSTNVALNHSRKIECAGCMAKRINGENPPLKWNKKQSQETLCFI